MRGKFRNQLCYCKSGKKYKKCCKPKDDAVKIYLMDLDRPCKCGSRKLFKDCCDDLSRS